ncbi:hypothetical protein SFRURICE_019914 [Spodoptera frugiperda]|nr:hypothetical protein SFRURICE_019914 [Spodoptera frugiperda]
MVKSGYIVQWYSYYYVPQFAPLPTDSRIKGVTLHIVSRSYHIIYVPSNFKNAKATYKNTESSVISSPKNRVEVQLLHEQGKSQVEISKTVKCSRRSLQFAIQRFYTIRSHQNIPKTGRKRITTDQLAAELSEQNKVSISARTTCKRLQEAGPKGCDARKKPWLPTKTKKTRHKWALQHRTFTNSEWSNFVWSDENIYIQYTYIIIYDCLVGRVAASATRQEVSVVARSLELCPVYGNRFTHMGLITQMVISECTLYSGITCLCAPQPTSSGIKGVALMLYHYLFVITWKKSRFRLDFQIEQFFIDGESCEKSVECLFC